MWAGQESQKTRTASLENSLPTEIENFLRERWKTIGMFNLIGGEPTLIPNVLPLLETLAKIESELGDQDSKEVTIISNLAAPPERFKKFIDRLSAVGDSFNIKVGVSAESLGDRFEYIRDGASFSVFSQNLEYLLKSSSVHPCLQSTLSVLSISKFHEFLDHYFRLCQQFGKGLDLRWNQIVQPQALSPSHFPSKLDSERQFAFELFSKMPEKMIADRGQFDHFRDSLMRAYDSIGTGAMAEVTAFLDSSENQRLKKMNWRTTFPELSQETK